jgi:predicted small lipoprotein YifL
VIRLPFISCAVFLSIAACGRQGPVDPHAKNTAGLPDVNVAAPSASGEPRGPTTPARADPTPAAAIPAALQGRWGLAPRDCTAPESSAVGRLVVTGSELRFRDSHAVPASDIQTDIASINGTFAFTGEGRSWTKYEALKLDNRRLTRTEQNPTASFSYAKCS